MDIEPETGKKLTHVELLMNRWETKHLADCLLIWENHVKRSVRKHHSNYPLFTYSQRFLGIVFYEDSNDQIFVNDEAMFEYFFKFSFFRNLIHIRVTNCTVVLSTS